MPDLLDAARHGRVYDLEQLRYHGAPTHPAHAPGFFYSLHRRHEPGLGESRTSASGVVVMAEHSGTHIDALCHQAENLHLFGGTHVDPRVQTSAGFREHGIDAVAPLVTRGVLIDLCRQQGVERLDLEAEVGAGQLREAADAQGVTIAAGDTVLVYTGNDARWESADEYLRGPGMGASTSTWLAEQRVAAVGADNMAWDRIGAVDEELGVSLPGHLILLVRHGIHIIENLRLGELARDRVTEFLFVCLPLKMRGATGSPVRPIAIA